MADEKKPNQQDPWADVATPMQQAQGGNDPWASVATKQPTQPTVGQPLHNSSMWESVKNGISQIASMPSGIYHAFADDPRNAEEQQYVGNSKLDRNVGLGIHRIIAEPMMHEWDVAKQYDQKAAQNPNDNNAYNGPQHMANMHRIAAVVPILGPIAGGITDRYLNGDKTGAVTDLATNIVAGAVVPKVASGIVKGTLKYGTNPGALVSDASLAVSKVLHPVASPTELLTRALKPSVAVPDFESSVTNAIPELQKVNPKISSVQDVADAARTGAQDKFAQYDNLISPLKKNMVDASPVGYAQMDSIPLTQQIETPGILDATRAKASAYMKPMPVGDLDQIRLESNAKLQDILSAPGSERAAVLRSNPEAARMDATRATTRDLVYKHIQDNTGVDPAPIQNAYGDLAKVRDVADKRAVVFGRQDPTSLAEKIGAISGPKGFVVSKIMKNAVGSDSLARLAFNRYGNALAKAQIQPVSLADRLLRVPTLQELGTSTAALGLKQDDEDEDQQ
jgi:hypothetical protein